MPDNPEDTPTTAPSNATLMARSIQLRSAGLERAALQLSAYNEELQQRVATLDQDELLVLKNIKDKLNQGLPARLKEVADTVGGFVW